MRNYVAVLGLISAFAFLSACQDEKQYVDGKSNDSKVAETSSVNESKPYRPLKRVEWYEQNVKCFGDEIDLVLTDAKLINDPDRVGYKYDIQNSEPKVPLIVPTRYLKQRFFWEPGDKEPFGMRLNRPKKPEKFWPLDTEPKCLEEPIKVGSVGFRITKSLLDDGYFTKFPEKAIGGINLVYLPEFVAPELSPIATHTGRGTATDMNFTIKIWGNVKLKAGHNGRKEADRNVEGYAEWRFRASIPHSQTAEVHREMVRFALDLVDPAYLKAWKEKHGGEEQ